MIFMKNLIDRIESSVTSVICGCLGFRGSGSLVRVLGILSPATFREDGVAEEEDDNDENIDNDENNSDGENISKDTNKSLDPLFPNSWVGCLGIGMSSIFSISAGDCDSFWYNSI
jgi:hypothetical protein